MIDDGYNAPGFAGVAFLPGNASLQLFPVVSSRRDDFSSARRIYGLACTVLFEPRSDVLTERHRRWILFPIISKWRPLSTSVYPKQYLNALPPRSRTLFDTFDAIRRSFLSYD